MLTSYKSIRLASAVTVGLFAFTQNGIAAEAEFKAVTGLLQSNPLTKSFLINFVARVNEVGKGVIQIKYLGAHDIVHPTKAASALQRGQFDILHSPVSYYIGQVPEGYALLASNVPIDEIRKNGAFDLLNEVFAKKAGARMIAWAEGPTQYNTYLVDKPKLDKDGVPDLSGIKMRATGTYRPLFKALGASTINMKSSEIYTGLQRGTVQGFGWPETGVPALGLHKLIKYRVTPGFYTTNTVVTMNLDKWKSLTKAQKDVLGSVIAEYEKTAPAYMEWWRIKDEVVLKQAGVKDIALKGAAARKYLAIAHGEVWKQVAQRSEYAARLRAKMYVE